MRKIKSVEAPEKPIERIEPKAHSLEAAVARSYQIISEELPNIIAVCAEHASRGSVQHAKFLADYAGIDDPAKALKALTADRAAAAAEKKEPSLGELILAELRSLSNGEWGTDAAIGDDDESGTKTESKTKLNLM